MVHNVHIRRSEQMADREHTLNISRWGKQENITVVIANIFMQPICSILPPLSFLKSHQLLAAIPYSFHIVFIWIEQKDIYIS